MAKRMAMAADLRPLKGEGPPFLLLPADALAILQDDGRGMADGLFPVDAVRRETVRRKAVRRKAVRGETVRGKTVDVAAIQIPAVELNAVDVATIVQRQRIGLRNGMKRRYREK